MYSVTENGVLKKIETWQVIIPLHDNAGVAFEEATIESILDHITLTFPGLTMVNCTGRWRGQDRVFIDKNLQVLIDALPLSAEASAAYFIGLKAELQTRLGQEKIYVTKESSKEEMISFDEFFAEVGIETEPTSQDETKRRMVQQLVGRLDFVLQRMGYETLSIRREPGAKKIIWERLLCGIRLTSTLDDPYPEDAVIFAADQIDQHARNLFTDTCVVIGHYEFLRHVVERLPIKPFVNSTIDPSADLECREYLSPQGERLTLRQFVERFTMSVVTNMVVVRDHGFRPGEITITVGKDGSLVATKGCLGTYVLLQPGFIPDSEVQQEILRCVGECCKQHDRGTLDPVSLHQAKAMNQYILKRAFLRRFPPPPDQSA
jgi:hypothetical protein